jgi:hypothetical protein
MTPAAAKKHRTEILAFLDGQTIQWRHRLENPWQDASFPEFVESYEYRVKPEPKTATLYVVTWFGVDGFLFLFVQV